MSIYDPPSDPFGNAKNCPICDGPLEYNWLAKEWFCPRDHDAPEMGYCAECGKEVEKDSIKQDPYLSQGPWLVCLSCYQWSLSAMGAGICENPIHLAEGGDIICPDCGKAV